MERPTDLGARAMPAPGGPPDDFAARELLLHGHRVVYRTAGTGPPVVLVHGMLNSSWHWREVALRLAQDHRVIAPDLLGHGESASPVGDYSLGAHAAGIRDLLSAIGVDEATIIGHSLGGGIAMQFYYQFPQRCQRLGLVSSGGLGREVSWPLRLAALPGANALLAGAAARPATRSLRAAAARLDARGADLGVYLDAAARALEGLEGRGGRRGFLDTLRSVIDVRGQKVSARDRLYLAGAVPTLIVWGERDRTIPLEHGRRAQAAMPGSRFETIPGAAHFPHLERPDELAGIIGDWLATTETGAVGAGDWRRLLESAPVE